jgi:sarcosine oxidase subunit beta
LGAGFEYQRHGGMIVIEREEELRTLEQFVAKQNNIGLDVSLLDPKQARQLEPSLSEKILGATFSPMDAQVNPMFLTFAFVKAAQDLGAKILAHTRVTGFRKTSNRIASVKTDKGEIQTGTAACGYRGNWTDHRPLHAVGPIYCRQIQSGSSSKRRRCID